MSEVKPSTMKSLVGRKVSKQVDFMNSKLTIQKLTVAEVLELQNTAKALEEAGGDDSALKVLQTVIRAAVPDSVDLTEEDFRSFPMDELSKLSAEIMKYSGLGDQGK